MSQVTANFALFSIDGLRVAFTLTGESDNPATWVDGQVAQLYKAGYRVEPVEGNLKPQVIPVVGYVRTTTKDPQNPGKFNPALALFTPWGDFTALTIYSEKLAELPFEPTGKVWDGGAFDRELITSKGYLTPCNMKVMKEPIIDFEGKPKLTEHGNQKWRFVKVVEYNGQPIAQNEEATEDKAVEPPKTAPTPTIKASTPPNGQSSDKAPDKALEAKKVAIKRFIPLAKQLYGDGPHMAALVTIGGHVADKEITGLSELTIEQISKVDAILQLEEAGLREYLDHASWQEALPILLTEYEKESVYDLTTSQINKLRADMIADRNGIASDIPF